MAAHYIYFGKGYGSTADPHIPLRLPRGLRLRGMRLRSLRLRLRGLRPRSPHLQRLRLHNLRMRLAD